MTQDTSTGIHDRSSTDAEQRILEMVAAGTIDSKQGDTLLRALHAPRKSWRQMLADPFAVLPTRTAVLVGAMGTGIAIALGRAGVRFDGAWDMHLVPDAVAWRRAAIDGLLAWPLCAAVLWGVGWVAARKRVRWVDFFAGLGLARVPLVLLGALAAAAVPASVRSIDMRDLAELPAGMWVVALAALPAAAALFYGLYLGFRHASGASGWRLGVSLTIGVVAAEAISKWVLSLGPALVVAVAMIPACGPTRSDAPRSPNEDAEVTARDPKQAQQPVTSAAEPEGSAPGRVRHFTGAITITPGATLGFAVHFNPADSTQAAPAYTATLDIPVQSVSGAELDQVRIDDSGFAFVLTAVDAHWSGRFADDGTLTCSFRQRGIELPCTIKEVDEAGTVARRPQDPQPPFPYEALEVGFENPAAGLVLAGTLTLPPGDGPHPAVLLISGSGPQDRDETLAGHRPFAVLADHLTRRGIAVLRVDDRGVGGSTGTFAGHTTEDFAGDAATGVAYLMGHPRVDPKRVGLIGHSEGGVIAPMVAARDKNVAFVVLLAPSVVPGDRILVHQLMLNLELRGIGEAERKAFGRELAGLFARMEQQPQDLSAIAAGLKALMATYVLANLDPAQREPAAEQAGQQMTGPWLRWFLRYDPAPTLRKLTCPVLAVFGEKDRQVDPRQNLKPMLRALSARPRTEVTVRVLPGLNHLFQTAATGSVDEYATIDETLSPVLLELVSDWVGAHV